MRNEWIPMSAAALVTGVMALVLGSLLNPVEAGSNAARTLVVVQNNDGRWLAMAILFFGASVAITLGLPAVLSLFVRRGRAIGVLGVAVYAVGTVGLAGYSMVLVFFRALAVQQALRPGSLESASTDAGLKIFLFTWIGGFYIGVLLIALALFRSQKVARWIPALMLVWLVLQPFQEQIGKVGQGIALMLFAIAFTGVAITVTSPEHRSRLAREVAV